MATLFLMMIYLAFIGLGLPDSLLGAGWPAMHLSLGVPVENAGMLSILTTGGTIVSSFFSGAVTRRFGTGKVTLVSVAMTALALLGFSQAPRFEVLLLLTLPLGLGAGSVDAALNGFVAKHFEARHMSWLHSFWGVGASLGPMIMSLFLARKVSWRGGYGAVSAIQLGIVAVLLFSLPLWRRYESRPVLDTEEKAAAETSGFAGIYAIPGVKLAIFSFLGYCALEMTMGLWGATFLVQQYGQAPESAARFVSLYYGGIMAGRMITGFVTLRYRFPVIIRAGIFLAVLGILLLFLPVPGLHPASFLLVGLGCAPAFPGMIHETPERFGKDSAQAIIGIQMAFAYIGSTTMPALFGLLAGRGLISVFPLYLLIFAALFLVMQETLNRRMKDKEAQQKATA